FSSEINIRLSQRSIPRIECFAEEMGVDPDFHRVGYLFLITSDRDVAPFERSLDLWKGLGVPARRVDAREAQALCPPARTDDVVFATFCGEDGYADPSSLLSGYVARAREGGAEFVEGAEVTAIDTRSGRVSGLRTAKGAVAAPTVVDAAGPWAAAVAKLAGVDLPIAPLRRHIFVTDAVP